MAGDRPTMEVRSKCTGCTSNLSIRNTSKTLYNCRNIVILSLRWVVALWFVQHTRRDERVLLGSLVQLRGWECDGYIVIKDV